MHDKYTVTILNTFWFQEAKLARQQMLRDDDSMYDVSSLGDSQSLLGGSRRQSEAGRIRTNSLPVRPALRTNGMELQIPKITIEAESDNEELKNNGSNGCVNGHANGHANGGSTNGILRNKLLEKVSGVEKCNVTPAMSLPHVAPQTNETQADTESLLLENVRQKSRSDHDVFSVMPSASRKRRTRPAGVSKNDYMRPMYRKDIFYSGSIRHIPEYQSEPKVYAQSITCVPGENPPLEESCMCIRTCIPKSARDTLFQMLDLHLLSDPTFLIACLAEICAFVGLFIPFVYVAPRALEFGIDATTAPFLLSVIGK